MAHAIMQVVRSRTQGKSSHWAANSHLAVPHVAEDSAERLSKKSKTNARVWRDAHHSNRLSLDHHDDEVGRNWVRPLHGLGGAITLTPTRRMALEELEQMRADGTAPRVSAARVPLLENGLLPLRVSGDDYYL